MKSSKQILFIKAVPKKETQKNFLHSSFLYKKFSVSSNKNLKRSISPCLKTENSSPLKKLISDFPRDVIVIKVDLLQHNPQVFYYSVHSTKDHLSEMKKFFQTCKKLFLTDFKQVLNEKGQKLNCLHELSEDSNLVFVSESVKNVKKYIEKYKASSPNSQNLNIRSTPKLAQQKIANSERLSTKKQHPRKSFRLTEIKDTLSFLLKNIESCYPSITFPIMQQFKSNYKLSVSRIHSLNAKFKTIVMLSCSIDPSHKIQSGINKRALIQYQCCSAEKAFVFNRIFEIFSENSEAIAWKDFLFCVNLMETGSNSAKTDLMFKIFDIDKKGKLNYEQVKSICKVQLDTDHCDSILDDLANYFASLIFDVIGHSYDQEVTADIIKKTIIEKQDRSLIDMFCSFSFLNI